MELGRKIDLSVFSSEDAYGWLVQVERYFRIHGVEDYDKLKMVLVGMEGDTLTW